MNIITDTIPLPQGEIKTYEMTNSRGSRVKLSSIGAGVLSIIVPDRHGDMADVVLGYKELKDYIDDGPCAGKIPGRYANRIAAGKFSIGDKDYTLAVNCGPNHLHGGPTGFMNRVWDSFVDGDSVCFTYFSADGEEGYPGNLKVTARYDWSDDDELSLTLSATTDQTTVINLTNHCYFNLDGENAGCALDHVLKLFASRYLHTDAALTPSGKLDDVDGTPMDFRTAKTLGKDINADFEPLKFGKGYDHCWVIDGDNSGTLRKAARLHSDRSGRALEILTTQPAVQVYTGNWLTGSPLGKSGQDYHDYDAVAIECQGYPDAPNHDNFPSQLLTPGQTYQRRIVYRFSVVGE